MSNYSIMFSNCFSNTYGGGFLSDFGGGFSNIGYFSLFNNPFMSTVGSGFGQYYNMFDMYSTGLNPYGQGFGLYGSVFSPYGQNNIYNARQFNTFNNPFISTPRQTVLSNRAMTTEKQEQQPEEVIELETETSEEEAKIESSLPIDIINQEEESISEEENTPEEQSATEPEINVEPNVIIQQVENIPEAESIPPKTTTPGPSTDITYANVVQYMNDLTQGRQAEVEFAVSDPLTLLEDINTQCDYLNCMLQQGVEDTDNFLNRFELLSELIKVQDDPTFSGLVVIGSADDTENDNKYIEKTLKRLGVNEENYTDFVQILGLQPNTIDPQVLASMISDQSQTITNMLLSCEINPTEFQDNFSTLVEMLKKDPNYANLAKTDASGNEDDTLYKERAMELLELTPEKFAEIAGIPQGTTADTKTFDERAADTQFETFMIDHNDHYQLYPALYQAQQLYPVSQGELTDIQQEAAKNIADQFLEIMGPNDPICTFKNKSILLEVMSSFTPEQIAYFAQYFDNQIRQSDFTEIQLFDPSQNRSNSDSQNITFEYIIRQYLIDKYGDQDPGILESGLIKKLAQSGIVDPAIAEQSK